MTAVFTILGSFIVVVFLAESLTRMVRPQETYRQLIEAYTVNGEARSTLPIFDPDEVRGYRLRSRFEADIVDNRFGNRWSVTQNGEGFRTYEFTAAAADEVRIVFFGDSTTFGWGVDVNATYAKILEQNLNNMNPGQSSYRAFNLGVPGYGPAEYYLLAKTYLKVLRPDVVIVALNCNNDMEDLFDTIGEFDASGLPVRVWRRSRFVGEDHQLHGLGIESRVYEWPVLRESHMAIFLAKQLSQFSRFAKQGFKRVEYVTPTIRLEDLIRGIQQEAAKVGAEAVWVILPFPAIRSNVTLSWAFSDRPFMSALGSLEDPVVANLSGMFPPLEAVGVLDRSRIDGSHFTSGAAKGIADVIADALVTRQTFRGRTMNSASHENKHAGGMTAHRP